MTNSEDHDLIKDISKEVTIALKEHGYIHEHPGRSWIKEQLKKSKRQPSRELLEEIAEAALDWAKEEDLQRAEVSNESSSKTMVSTSSNFAFGTYMRMLPHVRRVRQKIWGDDKAPFGNGLPGLNEALQWLKENEGKEWRATGERRPGRFKVVISAKTDQLSAVFQAKTSSHHRTVRQDPQLGEKTQTRAIEQRNEANFLSEELRRLANALKGIEAQDIESYLTGAYMHENGKTDYFPYLAISGGDGWNRGVRPPPSMLLDNLYKEVADISKHSGWWAHTQTLTLIMCGRVPSAGVSPDFSKTWHDGDDNYKGYTATTITLTVHGPTPEKEVMDAYREVLKTHGLRPKGLSLKQAAVLQLVEQTPEKSWAKRYERWLEWCDLHPDIDLPRYTEKSGAASLHKEHQRALKAASWGEEDDS